MPGTCRRMIDEIIRIRSNGDPTIANTTRAKLILKGINLEAFTTSSPDDPAMVERVREAGLAMGVSLGGVR